LLTATTEAETLRKHGEYELQELGTARSKPEFEDLLSDAISQGMQKVLGAGGTQAIMYHLHLPDFGNPKRFHERLSAIFGPGTESLERVILQNLHESMRVRPASGGSDFVAQVEAARKWFAAEAKLSARH